MELKLFSLMNDKKDSYCRVVLKHVVVQSKKDRGRSFKGKISKKDLMTFQIIYTFMFSVILSLSLGF